MTEQERYLAWSRRCPDIYGPLVIWQAAVEAHAAELKAAKVLYQVLREWEWHWSKRPDGKPHNTAGDFIVSIRSAAREHGLDLAELEGEK